MTEMNSTRIVSHNSSPYLTIYILVTLFLGTSVKSALGLLDFEQSGFLFSIHYIALPFLMLAFLLSPIRRVSKIENVTVVFSLLFFLLNRIVFARSATFAMTFNILYEPILLLGILKGCGYNRQLLRKILISFFLIECFVGIFEALTQTLIFMKGNYIFEVGEFGVITIRAFSLHGHPLQNSFLVCCMSVILLFSDIKAKYRYVLFFIGVCAVFSFNTRSGILLMATALAIRIMVDLRQANVKSILGLFVLLVPTLYYGVSFMMENDLGTRFATAIDKNDGSSMARFMLIEYFFNLDWTKMMFGLDVQELQSNMKSLGLVAIENSILNVVLSWGVLFGALYFVCLYKQFLRLKTDKICCYVFLLIWTLLMNVNNAIQSDTPVIPISMLTLYAFQKVTSARTSIISTH